MVVLLIVACYIGPLKQKKIVLINNFHKITNPLNKIIGISKQAMGITHLVKTEQQQVSPRVTLTWS